jgi:hypothetical protein
MNRTYSNAFCPLDPRWIEVGPQSRDASRKEEASVSDILASHARRMIELNIDQQSAANEILSSMARAFRAEVDQLKDWLGRQTVAELTGDYLKGTLPLAPKDILSGVERNRPTRNSSERALQPIDLGQCEAVHKRMLNIYCEQVSLNAQIDELVFSLYDLSSAEKSTILSSLKGGVCE